MTMSLCQRRSVMLGASFPVRNFRIWQGSPKRTRCGKQFSMFLFWRQIRVCVAVRSRNCGLGQLIIDIERRCLVVRRNCSKTDAGARHVELNRDATEAALRLLSRACSLGSQEPEHFLLPKHLSRIKYGRDAGKRGYDPTQNQNCWRKACASLTKKANLKGLRFHDLRHTFITHIIERGAPVALIQSLVGHVNARMVRHYTHITTGAARNAVALLDSEPILEQTAFKTAVQLEFQFG